jgi:uncharacterized protein (TIGR02246 family)
MRRRCLVAVGFLTLLIAPWYLSGVLGGAEEKKAPSADEKAVQQAMAALADAFNDGDAAKSAAAFTADAEFIDDAGNGVRGRDEIVKLLTRFLDTNKGAKVQFTLDDPRQVAADVILQDGESVCTVPAKNTQSTRRYTTVFARQNKKWLVASLREFPEESSSTDAADRLKDLTWLIGEWIDESDEGVLTTTGRWSDDKRYILRDFTVKLKGKEALSGTQRIAVDPLTSQIKGWSFDSQNGYGETTWIKNGEQWLVKANGVTSDGEAASATYTFAPAGKNRMLWKSMHRVVGDRVDPDVEVTLVRKGPAPK